MSSRWKWRASEILRPGSMIPSWMPCWSHGRFRLWTTSYDSTYSFNSKHCRQLSTTTSRIYTSSQSSSASILNHRPRLQNRKITPFRFQTTQGIHRKRQHQASTSDSCAHIHIHNNWELSLRARIPTTFSNLCSHRAHTASPYNQPHNAMPYPQITQIRQQLPRPMYQERIRNLVSHRVLQQ